MTQADVDAFRADGINILHKLVKMRFPDPNPDVFTFDSYGERYKLRDSLAETAVQDIEKSQRINRRSGNFAHAGLSAFHSGLIYLHEKDYRGARQQFTEARKQWGFIAEPAGSALAYFAEGLAFQLAMHYEEAMAHYRRANQSLPRIRFSPEFDHQFMEMLAAAIAGRQDALHKQLWPPVPPAENDLVTQHRQENALDTKELPVEQPASSPDSVNSRPESVVRESSSAGLPVDTFNQMDTPIPGHQYRGKQFAWYKIVRQPMSGFFPGDVQQGGWVLVQKSPDAVQAGEIVLVIANEENGRFDSRVVVSPAEPGPRYPRIYLAWLKEAVQPIISSSAPITEHMQQVSVAVSPEMQQVLVKLQEIHGVVVGFWLPVQIR